MDFNATVNNIVETVSGTRAAIIMANDGIALAEAMSSEYPTDVQTLAVEYTAVLSEIRKASEVLEMGELEELTVKSGSLTFLIRLINDEYFIALAMQPGANLGKGRYLARIAAPKLAEEL